ncbi:unnamed protein product [Protopolystoma xenopodis]|uniref:Uncharacterized protein n=1 Tax=Protopolystoma xenopodis TaxID=117903 RepID=A0A448WKZ5_9PLAT|nr:unnamed protein product [Protopolystoma xenopodis]
MPFKWADRLRFREVTNPRPRLRACPRAGFGQYSPKSAKSTTIKWHLRSVKAGDVRGCGRHGSHQPTKGLRRCSEMEDKSSLRIKWEAKPILDRPEQVVSVDGHAPLSGRRQGGRQLVGPVNLAIGVGSVWQVPYLCVCHLPQAPGSESVKVVESPEPRRCRKVAKWTTTWRWKRRWVADEWVSDWLTSSVLGGEGGAGWEFGTGLRPVCLVNQVIQSKGFRRINC